MKRRSADLLDYRWSTSTSLILIKRNLCRKSELGAIPRFPYSRSESRKDGKLLGFAEDAFAKSNGTIRCTIDRIWRLKSCLPLLPSLQKFPISSCYSISSCYFMLFHKCVITILIKIILKVLTYNI